MKEGDKNSLDDILKSIKELSERIKNLTPFGKMFEVKGFGKSSHVILPKELKGKKVLVLKLPEIDEEKIKTKSKKKTN